jgi:hypothetical protein
MTYARTYSVDLNPSGDTGVGGFTKLDADLTNAFSAVNTHEALTASHGVSGAIVGATDTQTLTNKTLTTPVIATLYQDAGKTKLITFPAASDTLVGKDTTDTLTNKTLISPTITGATLTTATVNAITLTAAATGFTIAGGTTSKTLTVDADITPMDKTGNNMEIGSDADGDMYYRASSVLARLAKGTANYSLFMNAAGTVPEWGIGLKISSFSRDMSASDGDAAITGTGFKPSGIIFISYVDPVSGAVGIDDGNGTHGIIMHYGAGSTYGGSTDSIHFWVSSGNSVSGYVKSMDSDGFTVTYVKQGSPTGTASVFYLAFR